MKSIQTKNTLTYVLATITVVIALGVISSFEMESYFKKRLVSELSTQIDVVYFTLKNDSVSTLIAFDNHIKRIARLMNVRITLIDTEGKVTVDSDVLLSQLASVENHSQRPEVHEAVRDGIGVDIRHSKTVGKDFLYVAKKVDREPTAQFINNIQFIRLSVQLEEMQKTVDEIRNKILIGGIIVLFLVLALSMYVSRRVSKPIIDLAKRVEEIRAGNLDLLIAVEANDEIGQLAQTINELVRKLKTDIVQLKKLEQVRSEFLGNVSHELRTPIFSLQGFLETLLNGAIDDPKVNRDFLAKAYTHASRLNTLLGDLIEISRIESGEMKMSFRYFSLESFLELIVSELQPLAKQKNITLTLDKVTTDCEVFGDKERLKQVMVNLIDNAIKYTQSDGRVIVSFIRLNNRAKISVRDTGTGISDDHLARIFERFYRVDKERSREAGGTGLGLAIVKHIVEAHGSTVEVQSEVGVGSTFSFDLKTA